ncbi:MAG: oligosaccharide flippase family protein [Chitinivibrionia bacterium]|nr:oligosaccharide flippase family protein [Chitinivibrionia bacterium]
MAKSISHQVGILSLSRMFAFAVMFFVPIINTRTLSVEHYGYYRQFWLIFETLTPILILGFPRSLLYGLPRADRAEEKSVYITQTIVFLLIMSVVSFFIYLIMKSYLGGDLGAMVRSFFWRLSFFTIFMIISNYMDWLFVAEKQAVRQALYNGSTSVAQALMVMLVSWYMRDVNYLIWGLALFALAKFGFAMAYTFAVYKPRVSLISLPTIREQLSFALPLGTAGIVYVLLGQTDKYIINHYLGREAFAIYSIGALQIPVIGIISGAVTSVTFPLMAQYQKAGDYAGIITLWNRAMLKTAVMLFPVVVFLGVMARPVFIILYPITYIAAVPVFLIYLLMVPRFASEAGSLLQVFNKNVYLFVLFIVGFLLNIVLSIALFNLIGRLGPPISILIVLYAIHIMALHKAGQLLGTGMAHLLQWGNLLKRFLAALAPGLVIWALSRLYHVDSIFELGAAGVLYGALYIALCARFRYFTLRDLKSAAGITQ